MPSTCCSVPGCSNRGGHRFPKEKTLRKCWVIAIRRDEKRGKLWQPTSSSVVCSNHFLNTDYVNETSYGTKCVRKQLKDSAVPSVFTWSAAPKNNSESGTGALRSGKDYLFNVSAEVKAADESTCHTCTSDTNRSTNVGLCEIVQCEVEIDGEQIHFEDDHTSLCEVQSSVLVESSTQTMSVPMFSIDNFVHDNLGIMFYTGLATYHDFIFVLQTLGEAAYHLNYLYSQVENLSIPNQFFLTLIKLRQHKTNFELSRLFGVSEFSVNNIWITWINFMSCQWREVDLWPERDVVKYFSPTDFSSKFPTTRVIIDGTECPVKKPKPPIAQQSTFSTYKNRNTIKVLAGATPGGLISYLSPAYGGSSSDRQIVERSRLTTLCDPGDSIMADKGFNVQDLFAPYDVTINIPTFFKGRNRMSGKVVQRDRKISSKRVHIERIIGLAKTYKILTQPLNTSETKLASEITFSCFMLCNFRQCIIPKDA